MAKPKIKSSMRPVGHPTFGPRLSEHGASTPPMPACHLPPGASQSPKGDLEVLHQKELRAAFPRQIKRSGDAPKNPLTYRKPQVANDYGMGGAAL